MRRGVIPRLGQVSWLTGCGHGAEPFPLMSAVDPGEDARLQWRYRGGLSPPSLFFPSALTLRDTRADSAIQLSWENYSRGQHQCQPTTP